MLCKKDRDEFAQIIKDRLKKEGKDVEIKRVWYTRDLMVMASYCVNDDLDELASMFPGWRRQRMTIGYPISCLEVEQKRRFGTDNIARR